MKTLLTTEILKLRTIRTPWVVLGLTQAALLAGATGLLVNGGTGDESPAAAAVAHVGLTSLFPLVLGILAVAGEYRHQTITNTYLGTPDRSAVVRAKLIVYTCLGLGFGVVGSASALGATVVYQLITGDPVGWSQQVIWQTVAGGIVWNGLFGAIGVGLGAVLRNVTAAVGAALAWLALVEGLVGSLIGDELSRWLPFSAGSALGRLPSQLADALPQWGGGLVLVGYALALAVLALTWGVRRDVA